MATKIAAKDIVRVKRGRKPAAMPDGLDKAFSALKAGEALRLDEEFGSVETAKRSTVSARIRTFWSAVREDEVSIAYTPDGIPQVTPRAKASA